MKVCNSHGVEFVHKTGVSKAGKNYDFWCCPNKNADGSFCEDKGIERSSAEASQSFEKSITDSRSNAIQRQHSQDMAIEFIGLLVQTGQLTEVSTELVTKYTDHFAGDIEN